MGKPMGEGLAEVEKTAWCCEYFAEHAEAFLQPEIIESDASHSEVRYRSLGTILGNITLEYAPVAGVSFLRPCIDGGEIPAY